MKKTLIISLLTVIISCFIFCGCDTEAERVNYNITTEAENFNVYRRVTVINCIKGDTLFSVEGLMNIEADTKDNQLEISDHWSPVRYLVTNSPKANANSQNSAAGRAMLAPTLRIVAA